MEFLLNAFIESQNLSHKSRHEKVQSQNFTAHSNNFHRHRLLIHANMMRVKRCVWILASPLQNSQKIQFPVPAVPGWDFIFFRFFVHLLLKDLFKIIESIKKMQPHQAD